MGSRVLSLWLPYLATDLIRREQEGQDKIEVPKATFAKVDGRCGLIAVCPLAERSGLEPGMTLADARKRAPSLTLLPHDRQGEQRLLETIRTWCERYSPWAVIDRSHERRQGKALWLDIQSSAHLFGGEAHLLTDLLERLRKKGLHARAAIADHPGSAWAIARYGDAAKPILPANGARLALASLPVQALRLDEDQIGKLRELGIHHIEPLYALPRKVLQRLIGQGLATRLDQALGLLDEPIAPNAPLPAQQAQLIFADPIMTRDAILPSVERLVRQLVVGLEAAGLGVRRLSLALYRVDGSTASVSIGNARPTRDVGDLSRCLSDGAMMVDPGFGIERAILDAAEIEPHLPESIAWRGLGTAVARPGRDLAPLPDIRRPKTIGNLATAPRPSPEIEDVPEAERYEKKPLRLLRQPEPIEAIAPQPDEPPVLFRWRQSLHRIVRAQGPERIAPDWWRIPAHEQPSISHELSSGLAEERRLRDYFAVEDSDGDRFWLFREGLYQTSQTTLPRWYLHGLF